MKLKSNIYRHLSGIKTRLRQKASSYINRVKKFEGATFQKRFMHSVNLKRKFSVGVSLQQGGLFHKRIHYTKPAAVGTGMRKIKDHHMVEIRNKHTKELVDLEVGGTIFRPPDKRAY